MRKTRRLHHKSATQIDDLMFKISKRKGSSLWQVRKRWPIDVAPILTGEFTRSTGENDRKLAEAKLTRNMVERKGLPIPEDNGSRAHLAMMNVWAGRAALRCGHHAARGG